METQGTRIAAATIKPRVVFRIVRVLSAMVEPPHSRPWQARCPRWPVWAKCDVSANYGGKPDLGSLALLTSVRSTTVQKVPPGVGVVVTITAPATLPEAQGTHRCSFLR